MRIGIITSGGDAPGMNASIRAVTRCALDRGIEVTGIHEGWQGVVEGGDRFEPFNWRSVGGILQLGGTILGTARSEAFRTVVGRRQAAHNLVQAGIDGMVVIGGDGSLTGALILYQEWPEHMRALAQEGRIPAERAESPGILRIAGLPGSIDNDQYGTDISIGADTALNTIIENIDKLNSTADSHQRTFVVEVMGRQCGYLALMSAVATGSDWVLIPEQEMDPRWHHTMVEALKRGREAGRRHDIIVVAEGARHTDGLPIRASTVSEVLHNRLGVEARVTVLGHVQRGGSPSAFDRLLASRLGAAAAEHIAASDLPVMIGLVRGEPQATPLEEVVSKSIAVGQQIEHGNFAQALEMRGRTFLDSLENQETLARAAPKEELANLGRVAILTGGPDAPGMNAIVRTAMRIAMNQGQDVVGIRNGFYGFRKGDLWDLQWMDVQRWINLGGSELGALRYEVKPADLPDLARVMRENNIRGLIAVGGIDTYRQVNTLALGGSDYPEFRIPMICVPATIDNNLPGTEVTIGADTALNNIVDATDKIKHTAGAAHRAFIVEVMGRRCGYLALASGLASGAEMELLPEEPMTLETLQRDTELLRQGFAAGKKLGIVTMSENASPHYDTEMVRQIMEAEADGAFEVRESILGHLQRGGVPSAFDRIHGSRLGAYASRRLMEQIAGGASEALVVGIVQGAAAVTPLADAMARMDWPNMRPLEEPFLAWQSLAATLAKPGPG
jgi:6-phosphofructokinase 1